MVETTDFDDIRSWILFHHERPDGRGYPAGLFAAELPVESRILAVSDAYEAMTSERPHRPARSPEKAAAELRRGRPAVRRRGGGGTAASRLTDFSRRAGGIR